MVWFKTHRGVWNCYPNGNFIWEVLYLNVRGSNALIQVTNSSVVSRTKPAHLQSDRSQNGVPANERFQTNPSGKDGHLGNPSTWVSFCLTFNARPYIASKKDTTCMDKDACSMAKLARICWQPAIMASVTQDAHVTHVPQSLGGRTRRPFRVHLLQHELLQDAHGQELLGKSTSGDVSRLFQGLLKAKERAGNRQENALDSLWLSNQGRALEVLALGWADSLRRLGIFLPFLLESLRGRYKGLGFRIP